MSKVIGINETDFFDLIEKLNKFNELEKVIATQVFPANEFNDSWYAVVYYEERTEREEFNEAVKKGTGRIFSPPIPKDFDIPASQKAKDLLKKLGFKGDISKLNKRQVWLETKKLKEK